VSLHRFPKRPVILKPFNADFHGQENNQPFWATCP
jgi:hypothetical protein